MTAVFGSTVFQQYEAEKKVIVLPVEVECVLFCAGYKNEGW